MKHQPAWKIFEDHCNRLLGLSSTAASGSRWHDPGDGTDDRHYSETDFALQVDAKYTEKHSFSVKAAKMGEWVDRAQEMGKRFAMPIRIFPPGALGWRDYVVLTLDDFAELLHKARQGEPEPIRRLWCPVHRDWHLSPVCDPHG